MVCTVVGWFVCWEECSVIKSRTAWKDMLLLLLRGTDKDAEEVGLEG